MWKVIATALTIIGTVTGALVNVYAKYAEVQHRLGQLEVEVKNYDETVNYLVDRITELEDRCNPDS